MLSFFSKKSPAKHWRRLVFNLIVALSIVLITFGTSGTTTAGAGYLDVYAAVEAKTAATANTGIQIRQLLSNSGNPIILRWVGWESSVWDQ